MLKGIDENGELVNVKVTKNGELLVKMSGGVDTSDANATANDIVGGKTAYVNGEKIEGTISEHPQDNGTVLEQLDALDPDYLAVTFPDNNESHVFRPRSVIMIPKSILASAIGLTADKIKSGETILGITGTYTGETAG